MSFIEYPCILSSRHFLTIRSKTPVAAALALSLLLHALLFLPAEIFQQKTPSTAGKLQASLRQPALQPIPEQPPLELPEPPKKKASTPEPKKKAEKPDKSSTNTWMKSVREQFKKLDNAGQFYPAEAIAQGLQGEVLVLFYLDENGHVVAARVEQGSGYPILDNAAVRAVRSLHSLPADAPREGVLPVGFKLH
jgi:protein TonB